MEDVEEEEVHDEEGFDRNIVAILEQFLCHFPELVKFFRLHLIMLNIVMLNCHRYLNCGREGGVDTF